MNAERLPHHLRQITPQAFALLGAPTLAYVRALKATENDRMEGEADNEVDNENGPVTTGWGIFAANGQQIGLADTRDLALALARQHDLEPVDAN